MQHNYTPNNMVIMHIYACVHNVYVCMYYSADIPLSAAVSLVKVPPAHDTCVLQALAPSAKVIMQAMFLYTFKEY